MKLLMKLAQFISNYQKSTLGGPMMKQFVYYRGMLIQWQTKGLILLMNVLPDECIRSHRNKSAPFLPEGTVKCMGDLKGKFVKISRWKNVFLHLWQDKPLWAELNKWESNIYYNITALSLFHSLRKSQYPEKWSVSFKNFFRKCDCISFYLPISSNSRFQL